MKSLLIISFVCMGILAQGYLPNRRKAFQGGGGGGGGGISWAELTQGTETSSPATTASVSPAANSQVLVSVAVVVTSGDPGNGITVAGCNLTWSEVSTAFAGFPDRRRLFVWKGTGASPTAEGLTITYTGEQTFQEMIYSVDEVTGANATPFGTPQVVGTTLATSLATGDVGTIDAGDYVYAAFMRSTAAAITPDTGTTLTTISSGANVRSLVVFYQTTDDTPSVTWSGADSAAGIGFTVEVP